MGSRGFFICVEGLDGSGKTTQAKLLVKRLRTDNNAVYTAEPSNSTIGKLLKRKYLHDDERASRIFEALLFAADRFEHVERAVLPALKKGKIVVSDRYVHSSLAYQGAEGLDLKWIREINRHTLYPDIAIYIDVRPETALQRLKHRRSIMEKLETLQRVREIYLELVEKGELVKIDGSKSKREVSEDIMSTVQSSLRKAQTKKRVKFATPS
jgi:dTMP kinase